MYKIVVTCPEETKHILVKELIELGASNVEPGYKAVFADVDEKQFYVAHLNLRTASNIILVIKEFSSKSPLMVQKQAERVHWDEYFDSEKTYVVDANQADRGPEYMSSNDLSKAVRLGIESRFLHKKLYKPRVDLKEPMVRVVAFSKNQRCMVGIKTSHKAMHKRGYRLGSHPAPVKETLAAAILMEAGYDGSQLLYDPMCGSGSIAIEAAMIAVDKAALIHRKRGEFGFENLKIFNRELWREVQDESRRRKKDVSRAPIIAGDIDSGFIQQARDNALRARVERYIEFRSGDFIKTNKPAEEGLLVANLPYGERLKQNPDDDIGLFYKRLGAHLKHEYPGWKAALLVAEESPYHQLGLKPKKKLKILNGSIPCRLLVFELFSGKHKEHKKNLSESLQQ